MTKLEKDIIKEKAYEWEKILDILGPARVLHAGVSPVEAVRRLVAESDARVPKIQVESTVYRSELVKGTVTWDGKAYDIVERKE